MKPSNAQANVGVLHARRLRLRLVAAAAAAAVLVSFAQPPSALAQQAGVPLTQQRTDAALRAFTMLQLQYASGTATVDEVGAWGARWYQSRRDTLSGQALATAAQEWVDKMRAFERVVAARVSTGTASATDTQKALYFRLDAEIELARVKRP